LNRVAAPTPSADPDAPAVPASVETEPPEVIFRTVLLLRSAM